MKEIESQVGKKRLEFEQFWNSIESGRWNLNPQDYHVILLLIYTFRNYNSGDFLDNQDFPQVKLERFWKERNDEFQGIYTPFIPLIQRTSQATVLSFWKVFSDFKGLIHSSNFPELFDFILFKITKIHGKFSGDYLQPNELTQFILEFMDIKDDSKVYNPFGGLASFGVFLKPTNYYTGQELTPLYCAVGKLRLLSHGNDFNHHFDNEDSIKNWNPKKEKFDFILTFPPLNFDPKAKITDNPFSTLDEFIIENSLKSLKPGGKLGLIISNNALSKEGDLKRLRQSLIISDKIETIVTFPSNLLFHTGATFSFIVLSNEKKDLKGEVRFIDATDYVITSKGNEVLLNSGLLIKALREKSIAPENDFTISTQKIKSQGFNLLISRYKWLETYFGNSLSEFISIYNDELFYTNGVGKVVSIKDLKEDVLDYSLDTSILEIKPIKHGQRKITSSSLIVSLRGSNLKATWFEYKGEPIFLSTDIQAFSLDEGKINKDYLFHKLYSKEIKEQYKLLSKGASIPYISAKDILDFKIEIPSLKDQAIELEELREEAIENRLLSSGLKDEILKIKKEQKEDLSIKKHNIMQHMNNVKESARKLYKLLIENNGVLNSDTIINSSTNMTVKKRFEIMLESIDDSLYYIDNITNKEDYGKSEVLYIWNYFPYVVSKGIQSSENIQIEYNFDIGTFNWEARYTDLEKYTKDGIIDEIILYNGYIDISQKSFQEIYNNIVENAIRHGFTEKNKKYKIDIAISCLEDSSSICFSFRNNGNPFPKGMAERYCLKGEKAGKFGNKGIGSWKVCDLVNHFGGKVIIHDLPEEEFPVVIDVILPIPYDEPEN